MGTTEVALLEQQQLVARYEGLRQVLSAETFGECLDHTLAFWTLPNDRRLPLAFLGRTVRNLLNTPFADLRATPGIGLKKLRSFVRLLGRVANTNPADLQRMPARTTGSPSPGHHGNGHEPPSIDLTSVSEVTWAQWRATVVRHALTHEPLGRLAPSLKQMTRVVWDKPLGAYVKSTLAEIRAMKTHGEKRVQAIAAVFHAIHSILTTVGEQTELVVRLMPSRIASVDDWVDRWRQMTGIPSADEVRQSFIEPLMAQIRTDATEQIVGLAEHRLGMNGPVVSVRQAARLLGLTRARVYQLLNEINDIMEVRWPTGERQLRALGERFATEAVGAADSSGLDRFNMAVELFYPVNRRLTSPARLHPCRRGP